jgi:hypothetical protein
MNGEGRRERNGDGNGRCDDDSTVMHSGVQRQWTELGQLNGDGRRVGDLTTMDDEEGTSVTAMPTRPTIFKGCLVRSGPVRSSPVRRLYLSSSHVGLLV